MFKRWPIGGLSRQNEKRMRRVDSIDGKSGFHRWEEEIPQMGRADSANKKSGFHRWEEDEQNLPIPLMR